MIGLLRCQVVQQTHFVHSKSHTFHHVSPSDLSIFPPSSPPQTLPCEVCCPSDVQTIDFAQNPITNLILLEIGIENRRTSCFAPDERGQKIDLLVCRSWPKYYHHQSETSARLLSQCAGQGTEHTTMAVGFVIESCVFG